MRSESDRARFPAANQSMPRAVWSSFAVWSEPAYCSCGESGRKRVVGPSDEQAVSPPTSPQTVSRVKKGVSMVA